LSATHVRKGAIVTHPVAILIADIRQKKSLPDDPLRKLE